MSWGIGFQPGKPNLQAHGKALRRPNLLLAEVLATVDQSFDNSATGGDRLLTRVMADGGILTFSTNIVDSASEDHAKTLGLTPGQYIGVSIVDTGTGMDQGILSRVFEPFFTTKGIGKGTGLGLASVYGVVKSHEGNITVKSTPGHGTTFNIFLPLLAQGLENEKVASLVPGTTTGRLIVVDDEADIRNLLVTILEDSGHSVIACDDGYAAVAAYRANPTDLVILDLVMPLISGRETFQTLKAINPAVKVLVASGYSDEETSQTVFADGALGFLQKPFDIDGLLRKVAEVLALRQ